MSEVVADMRLVQIGSVEQIPLGQGRRFRCDGMELAVFRQRNGQIWAVQNRCPHRQGSLADGIMGNGKVICPLHAHKFDLRTGKGSEGHECVTPFTVKVENGQIYVSLLKP